MIKNIFMIIELFLLIVLSIQDIKQRKISLRMIMLLTVFEICNALSDIMMNEETVVGVLLALIPGLVLIIMAFLLKEKIGYGDGLVMMITGMTMGFYKAVNILCIAFLLSAVCSVILLSIKKADRNTKLPFIPFITAAEVIAFGIFK